jgi:uncharacterized membrane protein
MDFSKEELNMKRIIVGHKVLSLVGSVSWVLLGALTICSIFMDPSIWLINVVMGTVFMLIGSYLYMRCRYLNNVYKLEDSRSYRFLFLDLLPLLIVAILAIGLIYGVIGRIFVERFTVFG